MWTDYLEYAKKQHAYKTVVEIITKLVRLHPTNPQIWIYATNSAFLDNGDMTEARSYMHRGLRFCESSKELWLAYVRLELMYLAKLAKRRSILGLDQSKPVDAQNNESDADVIPLPAITAEDVDPQKKQASRPADADPNMDRTPALGGAIPTAIFDAARLKFDGIDIAEQCFEMCFEFSEAPAAKNVARHVTESTASSRSSSPVLLDIHVREPLVGVVTASPDFPRALRESITRLRVSSKESPSFGLAQRTVSWTSSYLKRDLDPDIRQVLTSIAESAVNQYCQIHNDQGGGDGDIFADFIKELQAAEIEEFTSASLRWALKTWPNNKRLLALGKGQMHSVA